MEPEISYLWIKPLFIEQDKKYNISEPNLKHKHDLLKYICLCHKLKVDSNRFSDHKYVEKIFRNLKPVKEKDEKRVKSLLKLSYDKLQHYTEWVSKWNSLTDDNLDTLFVTVKSNPENYPLPILLLACDHENIVVDTLNEVFMKRLLVLNACSNETLDKCAKIVLSSLSKNEIINLLSKDYTFPKVEYNNLPYSKFKSNVKADIEKYEDLLTVGWLRDKHLYEKHPLLFFINPQRNSLYFEERLPQNAYTDAEIKRLISQIDPGINSRSWDVLKELHNTKISKLDEIYYGTNSIFDYIPINETTPGVIWGKNPVLFSELERHFSVNGLVDPWTMNPLSSTQMFHLLSLSDETLTRQIFSFKKQSFDREMDISIIIERFNNENTITLLNYILESSMIMRGWMCSGKLIKDPYPLEKRSKGCIDHELKQKYLDLYLMEIMAQFEMYPEIAILPLYMYNRKMIMSSRKSDGYTLYDRYAILAERIEPESCSRITGNWLLASSYHYLDLLGHKPEFGIDSVEWLND